MSPPARCLFFCCSILIAVYQLLSMSAAYGDANSSAISCHPSSFTRCAKLDANPYPFWASATCAASPSYVLSNCTPSSTHAYWDSFSDAALGVVGSPAVTAILTFQNTETYGSNQYGSNQYSYTLTISIRISWNISLADSSDSCLPLFSATNLSLYNIPSSINLTRFPDSSTLRFSSRNVILLFNCTRKISDVAAQLGSNTYNNELIIDAYGCADYKALCKIQAETPCIQWSVNSSTEELMLQHVLDSLACSHFMLGIFSAEEQGYGGGFTMFNPSIIELLWEDTQCDKCQRAGGQCIYDMVSIKKFSHCECWEATSLNSTFDFNTQNCSWNEPCIIRGPWNCLSVGAKIGIVVAAVVAALGLCLLIRAGFPRFSKFSVSILLSIMKKIVRKLQSISYRHRQSLDLLDLDGLTERPTEYSYSSIASATKSFSSVVGEGGFGTVYKGILTHASSSHGGSVEQQIAVKVLDTESKHSEKQFLNEVVTIGNIHHVNVVRLLGFCVQEDRAMLVLYEYVVNGSLDKWLFEKKGNAQESHVLDWGQRYAIALGVAGGLSYLHEECRHRIVHRDIKPQNILLDEDMNPKIADFGLARLMNREESKVVTIAKGTPGYMAPEFWMRGESQLSTKFDVYSYGMVLLELISGQQNFGGVAVGSSDGGSFPAMAFKAAMEGDLESVVDARMEIRSDADDVQKQVQWQQIKTAVFVALWCIQDHPARRPPMNEVVKYLEGGAIISECPSQPAMPISCASCPEQEFLLTGSSHPDINECTPLSGGR